VQQQLPSSDKLDEILIDSLYTSLRCGYYATSLDVGTMPLHRVCWTGVRYVFVLAQLSHSE